jgi:hypothetical protein
MRFAKDTDRITSHTGGVLDFYQLNLSRNLIFDFGQIFFALAEVLDHRIDGAKSGHLFGPLLLGNLSLRRLPSVLR